MDIEKTPLLDFTHSKNNTNFQLGQRLLSLKMQGLNKLEAIDKAQYGYKSGFPESCVNQLLWFAYNLGYEDGENRGILKGEATKMEELRKAMKSVIDTLDLVPWDSYDV